MAAAGGGSREPFGTVLRWTTMPPQAQRAPRHRILPGGPRAGVQTGAEEQARQGRSGSPESSLKRASTPLLSSPNRAAAPRMNFREFASSPCNHTVTQSWGVISSCSPLRGQFGGGRGATFWRSAVTKKSLCNFCPTFFRSAGHFFWYNRPKKHNDGLYFCDTPTPRSLKEYFYFY